MEIIGLVVSLHRSDDSAPRARLGMSTSHGCARRRNRPRSLFVTRPDIRRNIIGGYGVLSYLSVNAHQI